MPKGQDRLVRSTCLILIGSPSKPRTRIEAVLCGEKAMRNHSDYSDVNSIDNP